MPRTKRDFLRLTDLDRAELLELLERAAEWKLLGVVVKGVAAAEVMKAARARGLLVNAIGEDVLRLAPPLTLTPAEADLAVERLGAAIAAAPAKA